MAGTDKLHARAKKARATTMARHVLVCTDGDCGGSAPAKRIRKLIAREGLRTSVSVAKVDCLDICKGGTIAVVYPEGTWYALPDADTTEKVLLSHLRDGIILDKHVFLHNPLGARACVNGERSGSR